jgi:ribosomal protein S18 acetylase RimI-like enzyme|tara:strand:+ start:7516 stop:7959 length:444 start_codon:yes stop_codon:yes gene_type:complete
MGLSIRAVKAADLPAVESLWEEAGMTSYASSDDIAGEITSKLERDPELFLVGDLDGTVVATVMGTWDGHRGRIKRLAVTTAHRRGGLGAEMIDELEKRFVETGITKLRLEVWADNVGGLTFWAERGYELQPDIRYFVRNLDDSSDPC